ncbi:glycosyltransferase [Streptomyces gamaensis]|uniref:D-inositol 3-phosphate glycosyltransferase n=1 Tax=Streptomyces gamaensis TaxID=1763542 RepID=A0ABW0Z1T7_9ACTN
MNISFLLHNRYGITSTTRTVLDLAAALAARHDVEVVSALRDRERPALPADPRVRTRDLVDLSDAPHTYDGDDPLVLQAARIFPVSDQEHWEEYSRLTEKRLAEYLATTDADVVVATSPGLAVCLARLGSDRCLRVVQEHVRHDQHPERLRADLAAAYRGLDAVVTACEQEAERRRASLRTCGIAVHCVPHCVPAPRVPPATGEHPMVMAAGPLTQRRQYDVLIEAFGKVVAQRPGWTLRIFGRGPEQSRLREQIHRLGLQNNVHLMGASPSLETEWPKAALGVCSSRSESFPTAIVEAMYAGLPVVSTDCDFGPREIVRHGDNGLLTPAGDAEALASSLLALINDPERRARMGQEARRSVQRFSPDVISAQYEALFAELAAQRDLPARADCWVEGPGDIVVRITSDSAPVDSYNLLCVNRSDSGVPESARFPLRLTVTSGDAPGGAVIPWQGEFLPEGIWDVYVESLASGLRRRVRATVCDQRGLLAVNGPRAQGAVLQTRIPFTTDEGFLSVRSWVRDPHVEADRIEVRAGHIGIAAEVWGTDLGSTATVVARSRQRRDRTFEIPVTHVQGTRFRAVIPCSEPARLRSSAYDVWNLYLRPSEGGKPIRIATLQGDLLSRKNVCSYPAEDIDLGADGGSRVRAFYTVNNELALSAGELPERR